MSKEMENISGKMKKIENGHDMDINKKLIINMRDLNHVMRSLYEGKASQKRILIILNEAGSITQRDLTMRLGIQPGSASEILSKLENAGLISRTMSETDRRTANISLTGKGMQVALEAAEQRSRRHVEMFSCLSEREKESFLALLEKLNADWTKRYGVTAEERRGGHPRCGHVCEQKFKDGHKRGHHHEHRREEGCRHDYEVYHTETEEASHVEVH